MNYDAVIFDLDGTLTDSEEGIRACTEYALQKHQTPVPPYPVLRKFLGPPLGESFMKYCGMNAEEAMKCCDLYRERYNVLGWKENRVYPWIRKLLHDLKKRGVRLFVATGKPKRSAETILDYFGLLPYFDEVSGPTEKLLSVNKADLIARVLRPGMKAVMVGDAVSDIRGTRECGIDSVAALYGYCVREEMLAASPTGTADTPEALYALLCPEGTPRKGFFVTLEGVDGCGKSTQAVLLRERLEHFGYSVVSSREPGGCPIAEEIRKIVLAKEDGGMCAETEALLFAAARAQHIKEVIVPAVQSGNVMLCDRFVDSSLVYQGGARGLERAWVEQINRPAFREGLPGATLYLRMPHSEALRRRLSASAPDRIEQMGDAFQSKTELAYEQLAQAYPDRYMAVDAVGTKEEVADRVFDALFARLLEREVL